MLCLVYLLYVDLSGVPYVVVAVAQELSKDVDSHDTKTTIRFNLEDRRNSFIQNRISNVLASIGVRGDLEGW